jgi:hypothetical protein
MAAGWVSVRTPSVVSSPELWRWPTGQIASINAIAEIIDIETYSFDVTDCALMFKYRSVYGNLCNED